MTTNHELNQLRIRWGNLYATQGGGIARELGRSGVYVMVTNSKVPGIKAGDTMPDEWSTIPLQNESDSDN